ncbi:MAG: Hsp20/alpha crystallin family protein [Pseudomonadota bacterium]|nr:Hsp20/alpha crystallin family protein [Pseudomonadota bacterium]
MGNNDTQVARGQDTPSRRRPDAESDNTRSVLPPVDVFENESSITLMADMPGVPKDKLELKVEGDTLLIEGSAQPTTPEGLEPIWAEVRVPRYRRSFTLSRELDTTRIEASLKDGVLTLKIPKHAHAQARRIEVRA